MIKSPEGGDTIQSCTDPPGLGNFLEVFRWLTPPAGVVQPLRGWEKRNIKTRERAQPGGPLARAF